MNEPVSNRDTSLRSDLESLRIDRDAAPVRSSGRPSRRWKWWLAALVLIVAAVVAARHSLVEREPQVTVAYAVRSAPSADLAAPVLSGSGYVVTGDRYISIGVRVPGRIDHYYVEEGQSVHENDPLVKLDDRDYHALVERTKAGLNVARANLDLAEAELARGRALRRQKVTSQQELDVSVNKAEVARATVAQIEAELKQAQVNLDYTLLRAPSDGVILAKLKEVGEIAVPGGFSGSGDLIRMANLADMRAEVDVNEADLNRVHMGQPAEVTPDAYADARYRAEVVKMYPQVDRQKGTLKIEVHILRPDDKLLPDMSVRVTFLKALPPQQASEPAVLVPSQAVRDAASEHPFVWLVNGGHLRRTPVQTAGNLGTHIRIAQGVKEGDAVVTSDDKGLTDGAAVKVK